MYHFIIFILVNIEKTFEFLDYIFGLIIKLSKVESNLIFVRLNYSVMHSYLLDN